MEEMERYISGDGAQPLSYFTGLKKEHFIPAELLTESDMKQVLNAFDKMLKTWNIEINYPDKMPIRERYKFLIETVLEDEVRILNFGFVCLDYYTGDPECCAWDEYCSCLQFKNNFLEE